MYAAQILTKDKQTLTYTGLIGPLDCARQSGIELFQVEHPNQIPEDIFVFSEQEYFGIHRCEDSTGRGCCQECGAVIPLSPLDREINGGD